MNERPKSIWQREILPRVRFLQWPGRFMRWFFSRRNLRRMVILLAWTATAVALFYGEEHWRGKRAWTRYRQELESRGEQLDLKAFIPKPVPDEQNFAATPFVRSWFERTTNYTDPWKDDFKEADNLVSSAIKQIEESFRDQRSQLEKQWSQGTEASTEDLRVAVQHYRAFFDRLLSM